MLRSREKIVLALGAAAAALIFLLSFVVIPGISRVRSLSRAAVAAEKDLAELRRMRPELVRMDRDVRRKMAVVTAAANSSESPLARLTAEIQQDLPYPAWPASPAPGTGCSVQIPHGNVSGSPAASAEPTPRAQRVFWVPAPPIGQ